MDAPIGVGNVILPEHLLIGSNQQYLYKYTEHNDNLCFWRCLAYCINKPSNHRRVETSLKSLFTEYYKGEEDYNTYEGIKYIQYNNDYEESNEDSLVDEITKVEQFYKVNINVYNNDTSIIQKEKDGSEHEQYVVEVERRSMTKYETTLNLMRYENHFMYITDLDHIGHSFKYCNCGTYCNFKMTC